MTRSGIFNFRDESINTKPKEGRVMLYWTLIFLIIAVVAGVLGFGGIAGEAASIAKILFFIFLVLLVISLIFGRRRPPV
jgi:uncharacterized membrane protein YtjA (UPF0391 family)